MESFFSRGLMVDFLQKTKEKADLVLHNHIGWERDARAQSRDQIRWRMGEGSPRAASASPWRRPAGWSYVVNVRAERVKRAITPTSIILRKGAPDNHDFDGFWARLQRIEKAANEGRWDRAGR